MLNVFLNKVSVQKDYEEKAILNNIFFELNENCIYTILGKNGTGKSTLLKAVTGLLDENFYSIDGKIIYDDKNLYKISLNDLQNIRRNEIKYIFQDPVNSFDQLKTFGYYFNLLFSLSRGSGNEVEYLLEFFLLPNSKTLFKMHPYEVSGGMAQRISFILALLAKPKIILLDEPTSGIDAPIINLLLIKLKEFVNEGNSALMVTQDIEFAKSASSKIALLSNGTLSDFTSTEEFFHQNLLGIET
jgi:peptide/nickel transport system ATP-binding protein